MTLAKKYATFFTFNLWAERGAKH